MKNQLGQVGTSFDAKLACQTEIWCQDRQLDANERAKRINLEPKGVLRHPKRRQERF